MENSQKEESKMRTIFGSTLEEMSLEELQTEYAATQNRMAILMDGIDALKLDVDALNRQVTDVEYQISITPAQIMGSVKQCKAAFLWFGHTCVDIPTPVANPKIAELTAQRNTIVGQRDVKESEVNSRLKEIDTLTTYQNQVQAAINGLKGDYAVTSGLSLTSLLNPQNWPIVGALWKVPEEGTAPVMAPEIKKALLFGAVGIAGILIVRRVVRRPPEKKT